ncbi:MAG: tripartite tricarboxylate transporter permease [Candidatus Binatia bacterium]
MEFLLYFPEVFTPWHLLVLVLATIGGLLLGATPGLSPTMAVALLIPFTFYMEAASGLILLGAVYTATVAGGAVSAILISIPGAPANIATILDGHPLAKQGRATEALHYCFISSFIGGFIGVMVLIFFTPVLAEFALRFGPSHMFWIALLGVTVIGSLGSKSVLKGLFAGAFGLWLATIGYDPVLGEERFVFSSHLTGGINIIAALIGLFAIPEVLSMLEVGAAGEQTEQYAMEERSLWTSLGANVRRLRALSIGSVVGVFIGLIPGAGGQISGLIAYDQTKKLSGRPERFGTGEPDGIISVESANNAMVGPSLVPLLTLSVPGSPTAAVLLGGLLIHGLFPGHDLFTVHAKTIWTFIDSLLLGQLLMLVFGLAISRYSRFVMQVPKHFMAAAVTVLAVFGSYSVQNSYSDVLVMMALGAGMYFASKLGFSPAPVVLGIILGPIAETNYLQGKMIAETRDGVFAYFFTGTLNDLLIAICLISIVYSIASEIRAARQRRMAT